MYVIFSSKTYIYIFHPNQKKNKQKKTQKKQIYIEIIQKKTNYSQKNTNKKINSYNSLTPTLTLILSHPHTYTHINSLIHTTCINHNKKTQIKKTYEKRNYIEITQKKIYKTTKKKQINKEKTQSFPSHTLTFTFYIFHNLTSTSHHRHQKKKNK